MTGKNDVGLETRTSWFESIVWSITTSIGSKEIIGNHGMWAQTEPQSEAVVYLMKRFRVTLKCVSIWGLLFIVHFSFACWLLLCLSHSAPWCSTSLHAAPLQWWHLLSLSRLEGGKWPSCSMRCWHSESSFQGLPYQWPSGLPHARTSPLKSKGNLFYCKLPINDKDTRRCWAMKDWCQSYTQIFGPVHWVMNRFTLNMQLKMKHLEI